MAKIKAIPFTPKQREIFDFCRLDNKQYDYINVSTGRQCGKSTTAAQIALSWCLWNNNYKVGFFSPTYKQCKEQFNRIKKGIGKNKSIKFNKSELIIEFPNHSIIQFMTAENDNCRGFTFQSIIVDEACFVKDDIFSAAILPTVAISLGKKNGKCLLVSTPKEKNYFYQYCMDKSDNYKFITFTSYEGGLYTKEFLDDVRRKIPDVIFRNEYMAEFMDGGNGIFEYTDKIVTYEISKSGIHTAAVDWGMDNDYTVLTILNDKKELCFIKRWRKVDWFDLIDEIVSILKDHNYPLTYCETNGIGNMPFKALQKKYNKARAWVTSNKSKTDAIMKMASDIKSGALKLPNIPYLLQELDDYTFTFENGIMKFAARNGTHDDCVMSLAICNFNANNRKIMM